MKKNTQLEIESAHLQMLNGREVQTEREKVRERDHILEEEQIFWSLNFFRLVLLKLRFREGHEVGK